jgi:NADH:ubiquinone reductase (H+-translocating)
MTKEEATSESITMTDLLKTTENQRKLKHSFSSSSSQAKKHIVILGSGFAGIEVLKGVQQKFKKDENVDITLVSRDNLLLFTPMLPEVTSGMIETRHIVTPVRLFCKEKARFYEANVKSIDLDSKVATL